MVPGQVAWWGAGAASGRATGGRAWLGGKWRAVPSAGGSGRGKAGGRAAAAAPEPEVPMKLGTHGAVQPGPPDGSCEQPGPLGPSQQVSGQVRAGSGGQSGGRAKRNGGRASAVPPPLMGLQNPLYCLRGGGSAGLRYRCRFVPWHAEEVPPNPAAFGVGCSREGGQSMAPNPSMASVLLGATRDCLSVVCLLSLESTGFAEEVHSTWIATQCCRGRA